MISIETVDFDKQGGLVPAVVQDAVTRQVLMVGFMNREALEQTIRDQRVTFWSRTKGRLWQKGEESGNFLNVEDLRVDCDNDTLLILARPEGPTCHTGQTSCFGEGAPNDVSFLATLFTLIQARKRDLPEGSYTTSLFKDGLTQIMAKVEEESEEVVRAAREETQQRLREESGDLLYHLFVLLVEKGVTLAEVIEVLEQRHRR